MKIKFLKILRKYKAFKKLLYEFWRLYLIVRELQVIIKDVPQLAMYHKTIDDCLAKVWKFKTNVFGEEK